MQDEPLTSGCGLLFLKVPPDISSIVLPSPTTLIAEAPTLNTPPEQRRYARHR